MDHPMAVIDPNSVEVLREKVDAWREVEQENLSRYCEILDLLLKLTDEVDGHPANSVAMLGELKGIVSSMESRMPADHGTMQAGGDTPWFLRPPFLVALAVIAGIVSALVGWSLQHILPAV